jgi:hypothetical protein
MLVGTLVSQSDTASADADINMTQSTLMSNDVKHTSNTQLTDANDVLMQVS